jgi:RNA polymerase sigma-70 factor, ECF subfamily
MVTVEDDVPMTTTSATLMERVRRREDQTAWDRFVTLYTPLLHRWTELAGLADQDAADLIQEVFVILLRELPKFRYNPASGSFRGWLKTITVNKCRERLRRRRFGAGQGGDDQVVDQLPAAADSDEFWEREYRERLVHRSLEVMRCQFEPTTWQACWETAVNGRTAKEVSLMLGLSENAVYVAKFRVLRRLRSELRELLD